MDKLRKKVFIVISLILSLCTTAIVVGYNLQLYNREYYSADEKLTVINRNSHGDFGEDPGQNAPTEASDRSEPIENPAPEPKELGEMRYLDAKAYTVLLNDDNSVGAVISHSNDNVDDEEIDSYISEIIETETSQGRASSVHIGNLYKDKYAYSFTAGDSIVILNLEDVTEMLKHVLLMSALLWLAVESLIVIVSLLLTRWMIKPVQDSFDRQKQFIEDASHELKTPLTVIMASEEAYEKSGDGKWLDNIKSESEKMSSLVNSLLKLAQTEDVTAGNKYERRNISKLTETSALAMEANMFENKLSLKCEVQPEIYAEVDETRIRELITILVDNAIEHGRSGTEIAVKLEQNGQDIMLRIINEGDPIPPGEEGKIFERFYRGDKSHNRESNRYGLGLAIARNIVESHGGSIRAHSENGYTTMEVKLR